jgi:mannosyl-oligosaccharide alpha-1,2-mannosidase
LGGLDETYQKMYLKTIDAIRNWMLFRPMVPDNRDILFSGSVSTMGDPGNDLLLTADVDHLTCFIGGMVGMASKIFGLEGDLEIAKKLADGCVWAYESTLTGIMPEGATVMPCESSEHCTWNETAYWEFLDPTGAQRDQNLQIYLDNRAAREAEARAQAEAAEAKLRAEAEMTNAEEFNSQNGTNPTRPVAVPDHLLDTLPDTPGSAALKKDEPVSLSKRDLVSSPKQEVPKPITHNFQGDVPVATGPSSQPPTGNINDAAASPPKTPAQKLYQQKSELTEAELDAISTSGRQAGIPVHPHESAPHIGNEIFFDPNQPLSHKEYVEQRIKQESLPPGFVTVKSRKYILR